MCAERFTHLYLHKLQLHTFIFTPICWLIDPFNWTKPPTLFANHALCTQIRIWLNHLKYVSISIFTWLLNLMLNYRNACFSSVCVECGNWTIALSMQDRYRHRCGYLLLKYSAIFGHRYKSIINRSSVCPPNNNKIMELILWQNNLNLNCVNLNYWQVLFNKTEYYMGFKIVLNLILILNFFYLNIEHLKFNTIGFF